MTAGDARQRWLSKVQHDLVKRLLWAARDCHEFGRAPAPGELLPSLFDDDGVSIDARSLWARLRAEAPEGIGLADFDSAVLASIAAAEANDLQGVLLLQDAFNRLSPPNR